MEEEIHNPGGEETVSIIPFPETIPIARTFLKEKHRKSILEFILKEYKLFVMADNLVSTERTDWELQKDDKFKPYHNIINGYLFDAMLSMSSYPRESHGGTEHDSKINTLDCWFARCKKGGYTDPHQHGSGLAHYSYACYLELPSGTSSITFANHALDNKKRIIVREGDLLVFPSYLKHWSFDTEENRSLLSGNFIWSVRYESDSENEENGDTNIKEEEKNDPIDFIKENINVSRLAQDETA